MAGKWAKYSLQLKSIFQPLQKLLWVNAVDE